MNNQQAQAINQNPQVAQAVQGAAQQLAVIGNALAQAAAPAPAPAAAVGPGPGVAVPLPGPVPAAAAAPAPQMLAQPIAAAAPANAPPAQIQAGGRNARADIDRIRNARQNAAANATVTNLLGLDRESKGVAPIAPAALSANLDVLLAPYEIDFSVTGVVKAAMVIALRDIDGQPYPIVGARNAVITMTTTAAVAGGAAAVVAAADNIAGVEDNDAGRFFKQVIASRNAAHRWVLDLGAADQVRKLTPKNIEGYFMSMNATRITGRSLLLIVELVSRGLPNLLAQNAARDEIMTNPSDWILYHTSATSTAGLCSRVIEQLGTAFPTFFSQYTIDVVRAAKEDPWDKQLADLIPRVAVGVVYIWLDVAKQLPEDWFQGQAAYKLMNPAHVRTFRNFFREYLRVASDDTQFANLATLGDLARIQARNNLLANI